MNCTVLKNTLVQGCPLQCSRAKFGLLNKFFWLLNVSRKLHRIWLFVWLIRANFLFTNSKETYQFWPHYGKSMQSLAPLWESIHRLQPCGKVCMSNISSECSGGISGGALRVAMATRGRRASVRHVKDARPCCGCVWARKWLEPSKAKVNPQKRVRR